MRPGPRRTSMAETIENIRQERRVDTDSGVSYDDLCERTVASQADRYFASTVGELDRIRQKIPGDLLQSVRVTRYNFDVDFILNIQFYRFCHARRSDAVDGAIDGGCQSNRFQGYLKFAGDNSGNVQNIFDDSRLRFGVTVNYFDSLSHCGRIQIFLSQDIRPSLYGGQWCSQFVRECTEEFVL